MIVKNGRIYLWENNISEADLYIQVGKGGNTNQQVKISDTELNDPLITGTNVDIWYSKTDLPVNHPDWKVSLTEDPEDPEDPETPEDPDPETPETSKVSITDYLDEDTRKITIFIKIVPIAAAIQLGEMGLFVKADQDPDPDAEPVPDILISKTMMHKQTLSNSEIKILKYTINI